MKISCIRNIKFGVVDKRSQEIFAEQKAKTDANGKNPYLRSQEEGKALMKNAYTTEQYDLDVDLFKKTDKMVFLARMDTQGHERIKVYQYVGDVAPLNGKVDMQMPSLVKKIKSMVN